MSKGAAPWASSTGATSSHPQETSYWVWANSLELTRPRETRIHPEAVVPIEAKII